MTHHLGPSLGAGLLVALALSSLWPCCPRHGLPSFALAAGLGLVVYPIVSKLAEDIDP